MGAVRGHVYKSLVVFRGDSVSTSEYKAPDFAEKMRLQIKHFTARRAEQKFLPQYKAPLVTFFRVYLLFSLVLCNYVELVQAGCDRLF